MTPTRSPEIAELYAALSKFHSKLTIVPKETDGRFPFASLPDVVRHITPILAENHLEYTQEFIPGNDGHNILRTTLVHHKSKQWIESCFLLPHPQLLGGTNMNHSIGGSITYFRRYTLCALLGIVSDNEDNDGEVPTPTPGGASEKQVGYLRMLLRNKKISEDSILKEFGIDSLEQLPREAVRMLIDKLK